MRRRRGVRGEEVGVKKFNMTLKKKVSLGACSSCVPRMEDKQGLSGASHGRRGGCALSASGSCALSTALPSLVGLFFFKEDKTSH